MTYPCPDGHDSDDDDYCSVCGARIGAPSIVPPPAAPQPETMPDPDGEEDDDTARSPARAPCPKCKTPRSGDERFCEGCGYNFETGAARATWEAVIRADRDWFDRYASDSLQFPGGYVSSTVALDAERVVIGRSRAGSDAPPPEIDLIGELSDPGISRAHAALERQADGGYAVLDLDSTNGTAINDDPTPIASHAAVTLKDGDRVHVGAWTSITLRRC
jgi:hypothetical protein